MSDLVNSWMFLFMLLINYEEIFGTIISQFEMLLWLLRLAGTFLQNVILRNVVTFRATAVHVWESEASCVSSQFCRVPLRALLALAVGRHCTDTAVPARADTPLLIAAAFTATESVPLLLLRRMTDFLSAVCFLSQTHKKISVNFPGMLLVKISVLLNML